MTFSIRCPHCQSKLKIDNPKLIGKSVKCPGCKLPFKLERPESPDEVFELELVAEPSPYTQPSNSSVEARVEKSCPFCGESVLTVAKKCKHCGEFLDDSRKKPSKAIFKASSKFIGLLCSYHIMDGRKTVLAKLKPGESFQVPIEKDTTLFVKYSGGFGGLKKVECYAHETNRFSITLSQSGLACVVSRVDVIDSDA